MEFQYHSPMLSKADPATSHFPRKGSEHVHSRKKPPDWAATDSGPAPLRSALLAEIQGMQAAGLRTWRALQSRGSG